MMRRNILLVGFVFFLQQLFAQSISSSVDKEKILIGEPFTLKLQGNFSRAKPVQWPALDSIPHFEILEKAKVDTQQGENNITLTQTFKVTSWDSGIWQIPVIGAAKPQGPPLRVAVAFSPFDPEQPYHDIKEIIEVQKPVQPVWYWYLIGIALLILLFLLFFPKGQKKEAPKEFVADEGAYRSALKKLDKLKSQPANDHKLYYTELVDIFREYLVKRKNIQSFSKTTDDLAMQIGKLPLDRGLYQKLVGTLQTSDLVKFAKFEPSGSERSASVEVIRENIDAIEKLN